MYEDSFSCFSHKMGKRKVLPFRKHGQIATSCFDLIQMNV